MRALFVVTPAELYALGATILLAFAFFAYVMHNDQSLQRARQARRKG